MKIAIIGGTGLLGSNLVKLFAKFDVKAFSRNHSLNIEDKKNILIDFNNLNSELTKNFKTWKPNLIINCIALVNLDECENNYDLAYKINCKFAYDIAIVAKRVNAYFIHVSTDHYFKDLKKKHNEFDKIILLNNYAKTKFLAEKNVLKGNANSFIARTNIVGYRNNDKDSFFEWLLNSLKKEEQISLFTNYYTSPISVNLFGNLLLECYNHKLKGIYNISSSETINKYDFGKEVARIFGLRDKNIRSSIISDDRIKRAVTLGLDTSRIEKELGHPMPTIEQSLTQMYQEYIK